MSEVTFNVGEEQYYIVPMSSKILTEAQKVYNRAFRKAIDEGCLLKKKLEQYMLEQGIWNSHKEDEYKGILKKIAEYEYSLNKGGLKLSEAKEIALELREKRLALRDLIAERSSLDAQTVEGQADNERFNYLVSACVYSSLNRKPVYSSVDEYKEKSSDELAYKLASKFAENFYGISDDYDKNLTETKFLKRFKFIDDEGRFINKDGKHVDNEGNLLDKDGYRIDAEGNRIDINNNPIIETTVDEAEFIDDVYEG